jgi:hypothetical protein
MDKSLAGCVGYSLLCSRFHSLGVGELDPLTLRTLGG